MKLKFGPLFISTVIHLCIVGAFFFSWKTNSEPKRVAPPKYIEAKLVKLKTQTKTAPNKKQAKKVDLTKRKKAEAEKRAKIAAQKKAEAERQRIAKQKAEAEKRKQEEQKRRAEEQKRKEEEQRQRMLADLEKAMQEEEAAANEERMAEEAQSFIDAISQKVEQNWSRPPSARNGMKCELLIQLVPTGRVVSVSIVKSSGNSAFDRSAEQAVKKAEVFPEIKTMSPQVFEKYYRRLNLIFNPQDLRQ